MTDSVYEKTIDWENFWLRADEDERETANASSHHARGLLEDLFEEKGVPDSFADVGCGGGIVSFHVAENYPETSVTGYDAAKTVIEENREKVEKKDLDNLRFEKGVLPEFDPDQSFEVVFCFATLCYVSESEHALQSLYEAVSSGGYLVMGYTNRNGAAHRWKVLENLREEENPDRDPERYAERFQLVLEGESTLSYEAIRDALGTWPRSFWEFTDKPEKPWAWNHVPMVWVPKNEKVGETASKQQERSD